MTAAYPRKTLIGLTGNIATGKSLVRVMLRELGATTIDADQVAHEVIRAGQPAHAAIVDAFGRGILLANGEIDRQALGAIVFANSAALQRLEAITHPAVRERIGQLIRAADSQVVVIEAIKLLEGKLRGVVDAVWVVDAPESVQLARLMERRGMDEAAARQRMDAQNSQADKLAAADVVIRNGGTVADTRAQVVAAWTAGRKA